MSGRTQRRLVQQRLWRGRVRARGCSSMVERQLPKLIVRVRFPSPAPSKKAQVKRYPRHILLPRPPALRPGRWPRAECADRRKGCHSHPVETPRIVWAGPASPGGLTVRARPKARSEACAANPREDNSYRSLLTNNSCGRTRLTAAWLWRPLRGSRICGATGHSDRSHAQQRHR
jgi:hypothetical protein